MGFHRCNSQVQLGGNLLIGETERQQSEDILLALGEGFNHLETCAIYGQRWL